MINRLDLHALADGELDKAHAAKLREDLRGDSQAQAEYESILNFKDLVRQRNVQYGAEDCWTACQKRLGELDRSKRVESYVGRYAWAMCAVLFALILGGRFMVNNLRGASAITEDLGPVLRFGSSQTRTVSPELMKTYQKIFDSARHAVDPNRLRVRATSVEVFQDFRVAHYDLVDGHGPLALFVIPALVNFEDAAELPTEPGVSAGVIPAPGSSTGQAECLIWHRGSNTVVLAGLRSTQELQDVRNELGP